MTDTAYEQEMNSLKVDLALLRQELAALVAGVNESARSHAKQSHAANQGEASPQTEESQSVWADLWHKFNTSKGQGAKVVKDISAQVEKHPLIGILAAFGLGYLVTKLWYKEPKR